MYLIARNEIRNKLAFMKFCYSNTVFNFNDSTEKTITEHEKW